MEDPWSNAWGDPQKQENWSSSSEFITDDQADISTPVWETDSGAVWDDDGHLWNRESRSSQLWAAPTLDSIEFAKPSPHVARSELSSPSPQLQDHGTDPSDGHHDPPISQVTEFVVSPLPTSVSEQDSLASTPPPHDSTLKVYTEEEIPRAHSPDPDAFGTFEAATDVSPQPEVWTPSRPDFAQIEETVDWGTSWKQSEESPDSDSQPVDEWEVAKRQKEIQDQYVPPELLDSILHHFDIFAEEYWPVEDPIPSPYQHDNNELAQTLGIEAIAQRLIPSDLTLSTPSTFIKTFTSKQLIEAVKLTKHLVVTRNGPLAVYMNSRGSLSWEAAIKSKPDVAEADVIPSGWRIVPKDNTDQPPIDDHKKTSGGFFSFFGRRAAIASHTPGSSSPKRSNTPGAASPRSNTTSPRPSLDSNAVNAVTTKHAPPLPKEHDISPTTIKSAIAEVSSLGNSEPNLMTRAEPTEEVMPNPSAVSRFLGRFSKSKSANRNSIALSPDDLEFLSDIVPSANDEFDETDKLDGLSSMILTPSTSSKLPPPLAPPPRPLPPPKSSTAAKSTTSTLQTHSRESSRGYRFDLESAFPDPQPQVPSETALQTVKSHPHLLTKPAGFTPVPTLAPPLVPALSSLSKLRTTKKSPITTPTTSAPLLFDDDDFSDFQTSPASTSLTPMKYLDSPFTSLTTPSSLLPPSKRFDDFDDFSEPLSPEPPQVPEKPRSMIIRPISTPTPQILPPPSASPLRPSSPASTSSRPNQSAQAHRMSRQAESHRRALNLMETASMKPDWPSSFPSPLINAIPPPPSLGSESNLLDMFEESTQLDAVPLQWSSSAGGGQSMSSSASPPAPPQTSVQNGRATPDLNSIRSGRGLAVSGIQHLLPPAQPTRPVPPLQQSQLHTQTQATLQQWKLPPPLTHTPSGTGSAHGNYGSSRSGTPIQHPSLIRQEQPATSSFSLLAPAPLSSQPSGSMNQSTGSGAKLSAQDLSFFESL